MQEGRVPLWEGAGQKVGERRRVIVWADYLRDTSYSAISQYIVDGVDGSRSRHRNMPKLWFPSRTTSKRSHPS